VALAGTYISARGPGNQPLSMRIGACDSAHLAFCLTTFQICKDSVKVETQFCRIFVTLRVELPKNFMTLHNVLHSQIQRNQMLELGLILLTKNEQRRRECCLFSFQ